MLRAIALHPGRTIFRCVFGVALVVAILRPLIDVAVNLIEAERVRRVRIHRRRTFAVLAARAVVAVGNRCAIVGVLRADGLAEPEWSFGARAREIFALGFARQTIGAADFPGEPAKIGFSIAVLDTLNGQPAAAAAMIVEPVATTAAIGQACIPVVER